MFFDVLRLSQWTNAPCSDLGWLSSLVWGSSAILCFGFGNILHEVMKKLVVVLQLHYLLRSSWLGFWVSHFNNLLSCVLLWIYTSRLCPFPALSLCTLVFHFLISPCLFNSVFSPLFLSVPLFSSSCCFFYVLLLLWVSSLSGLFLHS